jgi:hypothetical protein
MVDPGLAMTIVSVTGIVTTGAVLVLRPISKRLGGLLDAMAQQRLRPAPPPPPSDMSQIRDLLTGIDQRLSLMEERQDFAEAILSSGEARNLSQIRPSRH